MFLIRLLVEVITVTVSYDASNIASFIKVWGDLNHTVILFLRSEKLQGQVRFTLQSDQGDRLLHNRISKSVGDTTNIHISQERN